MLIFLKKGSQKKNGLKKWFQAFFEMFHFWQKNIQRPFFFKIVFVRNRHFWKKFSSKTPNFSLKREKRFCRLLYKDFFISNEYRRFLKCLISDKKYFCETIFLRNLWFSKNENWVFWKKRSLKTPDFSLKQEKRVFAGIYHDRLCVYTSFTRNIYGVWYNLLYTSP